MFENKEGVLLMLRKPLFDAKKRPLRFKKSPPLFVALLFQLTRQYLVILQPAFPSQRPSNTPLLSEGSEEASSTILSYANSSIHSPLHYFPSVSDRWFGEGVRL